MSQNSIQEKEFEEEEFFNTNKISNNYNDNENIIIENNSISNFNNPTNNNNLTNNNDKITNDENNYNDNESNNNDNTNTHKQNLKILNSESDASAVGNIVRSNKIFFEKGIDSAYKTLTSNLFSTINSTFANFNNDYEKKVKNFV